MGGDAVLGGRGEEPRVAIQQCTEALGPLGAGQPAGLDVDESVCAIARHTTWAEQDLFHLFALHRFDRVLPQPANRSDSHSSILRPLTNRRKQPLIGSSNSMLCASSRNGAEKSSGATSMTLGYNGSPMIGRPSDAMCTRS